jgi:glycosyltransferase involved in cell wall biosynthesis
VTDVSVIIPCYNGEKVLGEQLDALTRQSDAPAFEVVLVDDGSVDDSVAVAERYRTAIPNLRVLAQPHLGNVAVARNLGAAAATGHLLLFCDADDVVGERWVCEMVGALQSHEFVAGPFELRRLNPSWAVETGNLAQTSGLQRGTFLPFAGGGNLGVRREVFEAIDGFDPTLPALEDTDFCFRAQLAGHDLVFVQGAVVHVRLRTSAGALLRQGYGWGHGTAALHHRFLAHGMPLPSRLRHLAGWLLVLPRLILALPNRARRGRWWFALGWRLGRLRGNARYRILLL